MKQIGKTQENEKMDSLILEIKLAINHVLFEKGYITEKIYTKAKELIIKS